MYFTLQGTLPLLVFRVIRGSPNLAVLRSEVAGIWCGSPIIPCFCIIPPKLVHQCLGWWCHQWIHTLRIPLNWRPLILFTMVLAVMMHVCNPLQGVSFYELIIGLSIPMTCPWGEYYQDLCLPFWWWWSGPVLACTLVDIRPSFIGARLKN